MNTTRPNAHDILTTFFLEQLDEQTGIARKRIEAVERRLHDCIDTQGERMLSDSEFEILIAERIYQPDVAIASIIHAENLLWVLTEFLLPPWRMNDPLALRVQLQLVDDLTNRIVYGGLVCVECMNHPLQHIREGLAMGRRQLTRRKPQKRRRRVPRRG